MAKRVRLSTVDLLPSAADVIVAEARAFVLARRRLQSDVREEMNARLADLGLGPISHSAFGRWALEQRDRSDTSPMLDLPAGIQSALMGLVDAIRKATVTNNAAVQDEAER